MQKNGRSSISPLTGSRTLGDGIALLTYEPAG
jgi:hypothetical protein